MKSFRQFLSESFDPRRSDGPIPANLTYDVFKQAYTYAFNQMMKYKSSEVGSTLWAERMAALSDAYPEWADKVEDEA
jgi:hypothetical protein